MHILLLLATHFLPFAHLHLFVRVFLILGGILLQRRIYRRFLPLREEDTGWLVVVIVYCVFVV